MNITDAEFAAAACHFERALEKHGVSADRISVVMQAVARVRPMIVAAPLRTEGPATKGVS
jgi:hypothetical protein